MTQPTLRRSIDRFLSATWTRRVLLTGYGLVMLAVLSPVIFTSVGADDSYYILEQGPQTGGSYWQAIWEPITHALDFSGVQPRTFVLQLAERNVLGLFTMDVSTYLSIPPFIVWATLKIILLLASIGATVLFLRRLTFRDRDGADRQLSASTIAFIATTLPLTITLGVKAQDVGTLNGWNFYPTLTYGPFVVFLLLATLALTLSSLLQRSFSRWALPAVAIMALLAVIINFSYELMALAVPLIILVVLLQPRPRDDSWWLRWRAAVTVICSLAVPYAALFAYLRLRISEMACQQTNSCYPGAVIKINHHTLWNNFVGALPGSNGAYVTKQADHADLPFPGANGTSLALAVLGAVLMLGLWASWSAGRRAVDTAGSRVADEGSDTNDTRGLLVVLAVSLSLALGGTVITGITARAIELLQTPTIAYRTNILTWASLSLAAVTTIRLLMISRWRFLGTAALIGLSVIIAVGVTLYFPRNVMSAHVQRTGGSVMFVDTLQREVALGDRSKTGDRRRCAILKTYLEGKAPLSPASRTSRTVFGAQDAFEFAYGRPFCSTGLPPQVRARHHQRY